MNHWKCGHQCCICLMLIKLSLSYRLVVIDRQAGFMWSISLKRKVFLRQVGCGPVACDNLDSTGVTRVVCVTVCTQSSRTSWFWCVRTCLCVYVCVRVCHALRKSIKHPQPLHSLHACTSMFIKIRPPAPLKLFSQHF